MTLSVFTVGSHLDVAPSPKLEVVAPERIASGVGTTQLFGAGHATGTVGITVFAPFIGAPSPTSGGHLPFRATWRGAASLSRVVSGRTGR